MYNVIKVLSVPKNVSSKRQRNATGKINTDAHSFIISSIFILCRKEILFSSFCVYCIQCCVYNVKLSGGVDRCIHVPFIVLRNIPLMPNGYVIIRLPVSEKKRPLPLTPSKAIAPANIFYYVTFYFYTENFRPNQSSFLLICIVQRLHHLHSPHTYSNSHSGWMKNLLGIYLLFRLRVYIRRLCLHVLRYKLEMCVVEILSKRYILYPASVAPIY